MASTAPQHQPTTTSDDLRAGSITNLSQQRSLEMPKIGLSLRVKNLSDGLPLSRFDEQIKINKWSVELLGHDGSDG